MVRDDDSAALLAGVVVVGPATWIMLTVVVVEGPAVVSPLLVCVLEVPRLPRTHRKSTTLRSKLGIMLRHHLPSVLIYAQEPVGVCNNTLHVQCMRSYQRRF